MNQADTARVQRALADRTGTDPADWFLVFKARYGMQVVFDELAHRWDAAGEASLGSVVTQAFTCATAVDPILMAGLVPVYRDIDADTYALDPHALHIPLDALAVVVQNTFGIISPQATQLARKARAAGALVLEDSAHCVGRMALDDFGTPIADVSVHSFGVEKMLPTRFGAAVWVSPDLPDTELRAQIVESLRGLRQIGPRIDLTTRAFRAQVKVLNRLGPSAAPTRAALIKAGWFEPVITPIEQLGRLPYPPMKPSDWIVGQMAKHVATLDAVEEFRAAAVDVYAHGLVGDYRYQLPAGLRGPDAMAAPLLRVPVLAVDEATAEDRIHYLTAHDVFAGAWYRPLLFPVGTEIPRYNYPANDAALPITRAATSRVFNLPTDVPVAEAKRIAALLRALGDTVLRCL